MKKTLLVLGPIFIIVGFIAVYLINQYNGLIRLDEGVSEKWAQVENAYQRRSDLIPNLVSTVKGYAAHEKETLDMVIKARSAATQTKLTVDSLNDPAMLEKFQNAQNALSSALSRLLVVVERYPDLKANQNFLNLQSQLEGTENRISVERKRFNEMVRAYNTKVRVFPTKLIASYFGFETKSMFQAIEGADKPPKVEF